MAEWMGAQAGTIVVNLLREEEERKEKRENEERGANK